MSSRLADILSHVCVIVAMILFIIGDEDAWWFLAISAWFQLARLAGRDGNGE